MPLVLLQWGPVLVALFAAFIVGRRYWLHRTGVYLAFNVDTPSRVAALLGLVFGVAWMLVVLLGGLWALYLVSLTA